MTRNGAPTGRVTPSTVTFPSSMTSSSADWVFGDARLISSASTMFAKIGPAWKSNSPRFWSKTVIPVTSPGSRSGVNWMRLAVPLMVCARVRASAVFPVPGTSSSSTWPWLTAVASTSSMTWRLPRMACSMLSAICLNASANHCACSGVVVMGSSRWLVVVVQLPQA